MFLCVCFLFGVCCFVGCVCFSCVCVFVFFVGCVFFKVCVCVCVCVCFLRDNGIRLAVLRCFAELVATSATGVVLEWFRGGLRVFNIFSTNTFCFGHLRGTTLQASGSPNSHPRAVHSPCGEPATRPNDENRAVRYYK